MLVELPPPLPFRRWPLLFLLLVLAPPPLLTAPVLSQALALSDAAAATDPTLALLLAATSGRFAVESCEDVTAVFLEPGESL